MGASCFRIVLIQSFNNRLFSSAFIVLSHALFDLCSLPKIGILRNILRFDNFIKSLEANLLDTIDDKTI